MSGGSPNGYRRKRCKSCGAVVIWAKTAGGETTPVDPEPDPEGNVELFAPPGVTEPIATRVPSEDRDAPRLFDLEERVRYKPHWSSCPQAHEWRIRLQRGITVK